MYNQILSINLKIADREYPMQVEMQEEEKLRIVAKAINEKIKDYKNEFNIQDKQDLLAMLAIDLMMSKLAVETEMEELKKVFLAKISNINHTIDTII